MKCTLEKCCYYDESDNRNVNCSRYGDISLCKIICNGTGEVASEPVEMDRVDTLKIQFRATENYFLMFHDVKNDNKEVGKLFLKDGKIDFTGEATDSAKILIDELKRMWIKEKE